MKELNKDKAVDSCLGVGRKVALRDIRIGEFQV
jgi:hypothetical protein